MPNFARIRIRTLAVLATVLSPFTKLRFGFFGFSEVLVGALFLQQLSKGVRRSALGKLVLTRFWLVFVTASIVGALLNITMLAEQTSTLAQVAFDASAYFFVLITCFTFERMATHDSLDVPKFSNGVVLTSGAVFITLFIVSFFRESLFGLSLKYYSYFVPWADNLHQISMFLVPLPFLSLLLMGDRRSLLRRIAVGFLMFMFAWMAFRTGSAKAVLALVVGAAMLCYSFLMKKSGKRYSILLTIAFLAAFVAILASGNWFNLAQMLFDAEDLQGGRHFLYSEGFRMIASSPLFGRGPGAHVLDLGVYRDAHETLLTILLQSGVVGAVAFLWLLWRIGRRVIFEPALLAAFSTLVVYAAGGDIMRRAPAWIMLFVIAHYPSRADGGYKAGSSSSSALRDGG